MSDLSYRTSRSLELLERAITRRLAVPGGPSYRVVFEGEVFAAVIEEFAMRGFMIDTHNVNPNFGTRKTLFDETFGITYEQIEPRIREWASEIEIGREPIENGVSDKPLKTAEEIHDRSGFVTLPVLRTLSQKEALAIAFLPLRPVRFHLERAMVSDILPGPQPGGVAMHHDLMAGTGGSGYGVNALAKKSLDAWVEAINASWMNWYLMLGGTLPGENPPLQREDPNREAVVRAILYRERYLDSEEPINWTSPEGTIETLYNTFLMWEDPSEFLLNSQILDYFFKKTAPDFFAEMTPAGTQYREQDLTSALDVLIARLLRNPKINLNADKPLSELLQKFPTSAASATILIRKSKD